MREFTEKEKSFLFEAVDAIERTISEFDCKEMKPKIVQSDYFFDWFSSKFSSEKELYEFIDTIQNKLCS